MGGRHSNQVMLSAWVVSCCAVPSRSPTTAHLSSTCAPYAYISRDSPHRGLPNTPTGAASADQNSTQTAPRTHGSSRLMHSKEPGQHVFLSDSQRTQGAPKPSASTELGWAGWGLVHAHAGAPLATRTTASPPRHSKVPTDMPAPSPARGAHPPPRKFNGHSTCEHQEPKGKRG